MHGWGRSSSGPAGADAAPVEEPVEALASDLDALLADDATAAAERPAPPSPPQSRLRRFRMSFRQWRRTRPFWGGLWCLIGGVIIAYGPFTVVKLILVSGTVVWAGLMVGVLVALMGLFLWFTPQFHPLVGVLAALFSVLSLITSNFGGFVIGMLLGIVGGAMGFAWRPLPQPASQTAEPAMPVEPATPAPAETSG